MIPSRSTGLDRVVVLLDGYDASEWSRYSSTVQLICSGKIKQIKRD